MKRLCKVKWFSFMRMVASSICKSLINEHDNLYHMWIPSLLYQKKMSLALACSEAVLSALDSTECYATLNTPNITLACQFMR
ncbi:unnamed protein product [Moneuplotes crassus]|uniref:Uncharacterized protein n=1 Tax=Euplotes crassus TaxID=5936 RepID=A0AAD1Y7B1_EUPCR|nr:unnamed protein product [Moneuplotes crassus]